MRGIYTSSRLNVVFAAIGVAKLVAAFVLIRSQTAVGDKQFLRSMIPHHSGAILMCEQAKLERQDTKALCETIIKSPSDEIRKMKNMLDTSSG